MKTIEKIVFDCKPIKPIICISSRVEAMKENTYIETMKKEVRRGFSRVYKHRRN